MAVFTLAMKTKTTSTMNFAETCVGGHFYTSFADSYLKIGFHPIMLPISGLVCSVTKVNLLQQVVSMLTTQGTQQMSIKVHK